MKRRDFLKSLAATAAGAPLAGTLRGQDHAGAQNNHKDVIEHCASLIRSYQLGPEFGEGEGAVTLRLKLDPHSPFDVLQGLKGGKFSPERTRILMEGIASIRKQLYQVDLKPEAIDPNSIQEGEIKILMDNKLVPAKEVPTENDGIRVVPYFANIAMLGLADSYEVTKNFDDLKRVAKWMRFYEKNQDPERGYISDFGGSLSERKFISNHNVDSVDSYAATFMDLARRYQEITSKLPAEKQQELEEIIPQKSLVNAVLRSFNAIRSVTSCDLATTGIDSGRTICKPDVNFKKTSNVEAAKMPGYYIEYLMDNVEVLSGLRSGEQFLRHANRAFEAEMCRTAAAKLEKGLDIFNQKDHIVDAQGGRVLGYYWGRHAWLPEHPFPNGPLEANRNENPYPQGLANVIGLAYMPTPSVKEKKELFRQTAEKFKSEEPLTAARFYIAASAIGDQELMKEWEKKAVAEAKALSDCDFVQRPGLSILALTGGLNRIIAPQPAAHRRH